MVKVMKPVEGAVPPRARRPKPAAMSEAGTEEEESQAGREEKGGEVGYDQPDYDMPGYDAVRLSQLGAFVGVYQVRVSFSSFFLSSFFFFCCLFRCCCCCCCCVVVACSCWCLSAVTLLDSPCRSARGSGPGIGNGVANI